MIGAEIQPRELRLDSNRRIAKRLATWRHAQEALEFMLAEGNSEGAAKLKHEMKVLRTGFATHCQKVAK